MPSASTGTGVMTPSMSDTSAIQTQRAPHQEDEKISMAPPNESKIPEVDGASDESDESDTAKRAKLGHVALQVRTKKKKTDRIKELETLVNAMEDKHALLLTRFNAFQAQVNSGIGTGDAEADANEEPNSRIVRRRLNPQYWKKFQEAPYQKNVYPIDVLIGEPELPKTRKKWSHFAVAMIDDEEEEDQREPTISESVQEEFNGDAEKELRIMKGTAMPERIRLSIFSVQYLLKKLLDTKTGIPHGYSSKGVIMLRPYKPFFLGESALRTGLTRLLKLIENLERQRGRSNSTESDREQIESARDSDGNYTVIELHDLKDMLEKLELVCCDECTELLHDNFQTTAIARDIVQCLLNFFDDFVKPIHDRHRKRTSSRVAFADLWHLFQPGDEIIMKPKEIVDEEHPWYASLLRVLRVQGGRPHIYPRDVAPYISGVQAVIQPAAPPPPAGTPVREPPPPRPKSINGIIPFTVDAYYLDFNGHRILPIRKRFFIEPFAGERDVQELEVYPYEFASDSENHLQRETLIAQGKRFLEYVYSKAASHVECKGAELDTRDELSEQLLVDMREYWKWNNTIRPVYQVPEELDVSETSDCYLPIQCREGPDCRHRKTRIFSDQFVDKDHMDDHVEKHKYFQIGSSLQPKQMPSLTDDDLAICTFRLFAWGLHSRKWVQVHVDHLSPVRRIREDMGFNLLVLPEEHKQIIQAQVQEHFRKKMSLASSPDHSLDLVRGKGQGLIILLHGAPGVGKTATAECIADLVQRPLYPITCGDLGSTALEVEKELSRHFDLASRWDCVMLLDEADVFLAKRSREDHGRNAIVSVFLRMLEYYKGILFLTTNRIGTFDEAFKSRIHISLFYPNFDEETTVSVWKTFIKQTKKANASRKNFHIDTKGIKSFARDHYNRNPESSRWNGRQIRNAFHTAIAMAEYEARAKESKTMVTDPIEYGKEMGDVKVELGRRQFDVISSTVRQFDDYMKDTMGATYEEKMEHEKVRKTKFRSKDKKSKKSKRPKYESSESSSDSSSEEKQKTKRSSKKAKDVSSSNSSSEEKLKGKKASKKAQNDSDSDPD